MLRATAFAQAFVAAAATKGTKDPSCWVSRQVADRAKHTSVGVVKEKDVAVRCTHATRNHIMATKGVDVWS